jgi:uncharacterized protein (TIGR03083 family)
MEIADARGGTHHQDGPDSHDGHDGPVHDRVVDAATIPAIGREEMVGLATTEYARILTLLRDLDAGDWRSPTVCEGWTVHDMVAHLLGAAEANASLVENARQVVRGARRTRADDRPLVDGINEVQIDDRDDLAPAELIERLAAVAPRAVRGRRRTPPPLRRVPVPGPFGTSISLGFLVDIAYTRDQWMHRVDLAAATGRDLLLTADHDGRIVADIVRDWVATHGRPVTLELAGPAGGSFRHDVGGPNLHLDAVAFCLAVSGRAPAEGLLGVQVVF